MPDPMKPKVIAVVGPTCVGKSALAIGLACWAFFTFSALPSQFREWKAAEIAKSGLKEAGLWPVLPSDAMAVEQCLKALSWCHVAGFRRILPR